MREDKPQINVYSVMIHPIQRKFPTKLFGKRHFSITKIAKYANIRVSFVDALRIKNKFK